MRTPPGKTPGDRLMTNERYPGKETSDGDPAEPSDAVSEEYPEETHHDQGAIWKKQLEKKLQNIRRRDPNVYPLY
jgi:hypothetical protein